MGLQWEVFFLFLGGAQGPVFQCSLWHFKALSVSPAFKASWNDTFLTVLHHTPCPEGSCCTAMKDSSFMVNFTMCATTEAH